jgi:hypothetical protein
MLGVRVLLDMIILLLDFEPVEQYTVFIMSLSVIAPEQGADVAVPVRVGSLAIIFL